VPLRNNASLARRSASPLDSPYLALVAPAIALLCALGLWWTLDPEHVKALLKEGGRVERPTELLYFALAAAMWLWRRPDDDGLGWAALSVLFVAFGAREMDLHRAWTGGSMLKLSFYLRDGAPLLQKAVSAAVVLLVAGAALLLLRRHARRVVSGIARGEAVPITVAIFIATMVVSKVFDRSVNILAEDYGIATPLSINALVAAVEEISELSLPFVAAIGFFQHRRATRS
jgi:hypothetical protein